MVKNNIFRGKRLSDDVFIRGTLIITDGHRYISQCSPCIKQLDNDHEAMSISMEAYEVSPSSVWRYCELSLYADGDDIFTDDIIEIKCFTDDFKTEVYIGYLEDSPQGHGLRILNHDGCHEWRYLCDLRGDIGTEYRVLGNIHDNLELLK